MKIAFAGLAALAVAMGVGRFAFTPLLPMMQADAGVSVAQGGWLASANYLGYLVGALWAGTLRISASTAIRAGLAVIAASTLAMALDAGVAAWAVLRTVAGVASAFVLIHTSAWCLERIVPQRKPILAGVLYAGVGTGIFVAGALCVLLMARQASSSSAWLVLGVLSLAMAAVVWPVFRSSAQSEAVSSAPHRWTWEQARLVMAYGAYGFGYIIPATFLPVLAKGVVSDPAVFGWAWPAYGAAAALATLLVAQFSGSLSNRAALIGCHLVMAFGVAAPVFWPGIGGIVLAALCVGSPFVVVTMVGMQEARAVAGPQAPRLMAAMTAAFAAGQVLGPLSVSFLLGAVGGFDGMLLFAAGVMVAGAALLVRR
jgi:predicted MFS family arabinose efflux permease